MRSGGDERDEFFLCFTLLVIVRTEVLTLTDALPFPHTHTHIHQQELINYVSVRSKPTNQYKMSGVAIDQKCGRCLMSARKRARRELSMAERVADTRVSAPPGWLHLSSWVLSGEMTHCCVFLFPIL